MTLSNYLEKHKIKRADFAEKIGISEGYLSRLINHERRPSGALAFAIEQATSGKVPASAFFGRAGREVA